MLAQAAADDGGDAAQQTLAASPARPTRLAPLVRPSACGAADGWRLELAAAALSSLAFGGAALAVRSATRSATGDARLAERAVLVFCASPANAPFLGA